MPYELMTIGAAPCEESCAQVGTDDYEERSQRECRVYKRLLERLVPLPADAPVTLVVKSFAHDFGPYREVCVRYDSSDGRACDYAYLLEANSPAHWDAVANYELAWLERSAQLQRALRAGAMRADDVPPAYRGGALPALPSDLTFAELIAAYPL
jgi:hypothetical protein